MKKCYACGTEFTLESVPANFNPNSTTPDGYVGKCKSCMKKDKNTSPDPISERVKERDRLRGRLPHRIEAVKLYTQTDAYKKSHHEANKLWRKNNKIKRKAHDAIKNAIAYGKLVPLSCEICEEEAQAHHDDYTKPLDVRWLCDKHHKAHHKGERERLRKAKKAPSS